MSTIPAGICQCGCGQRTTLVTKTKSKEGYVKGQPRRYVHGHYMRGPEARPPEVRGDTFAFFLCYQGDEFEVLIDVSDVDQVMALHWSLAYHRKTNRWLIRAHLPMVNGKQKLIYLHRLITGALPGQLVDHRDGNIFDNRRRNLRGCGHFENAWNRGVSPKNKSGYKGVSSGQRPGAWVAYITKDRKSRNLGTFSSAEAAAHAYDEAARRLFGEFARLNFPREGEVSARPTGAPHWRAHLEWIARDA